MSVATEVQREVFAADGDVAAFDFRPIESLLAGSIVRQRFNMLLLGTFAGMALTLSAVGLYEVIPMRLLGALTRSVFAWLSAQRMLMFCV